MVVAAVVGIAGAGLASAAPAGAATNLSFSSQVCESNGTVSGVLSWSPSGAGGQYVDLANDAGFSKFSRGGPYASSASSVRLTQLKVGRTYYARVLTTAGSATLSSDVAIIAANCPAPSAITKPTHLSAQALGDGTVALDWTPGASNRWYCVDIALSLSDLFNTQGTWRNYGCWTTNSALTVSGLSCSTQYYWLVYAWNDTSNVKSDPNAFQTSSCASTISAPTGLTATRLDSGGILFDWNAGAGDIWYCVDTARSSADLLGLTGTWRNHGCWNTDTQLVVSNLDCSQTYYWLVYAWNYVANTKSTVSTVQTQSCKSQIELAPIIDVQVTKLNGAYEADITAALPNGCHTPDSHQIQRIGNTIEITVWNSVAPSPCTYIYSEYQLNVNLGSNFVSGQTYKVVVNDDKSDTFKAD
jgi:hypothetical protein